jgi:hypothetical protein
MVTDYSEKNKASMFAPGKHFPPSLTNVTKARAYLSGAPYSVTRIISDRAANAGHSGVFDLSVSNDEEKGFISLTTRVCTVKFFAVKLECLSL